ncbi:MAG: T9SS type A sorting domain-containing protein [Bacteroidetes bacterium]|nr:T9SS type A sorting domain-containing protein [Bacteroidota bacterium]
MKKTLLFACSLLTFRSRMAPLKSLSYRGLFTGMAVITLLLLATGMLQAQLYISQLNDPNTGWQTERSVTLTNSGSASLTMNGWVFEITANLSAGGTCTAFIPLPSGTLGASRTITIHINDWGGANTDFSNAGINHHYRATNWSGNCFTNWNGLGHTQGDGARLHYDCPSPTGRVLVQSETTTNFENKTVTISNNSTPPSCLSCTATTPASTLSGGGSFCAASATLSRTSAPSGTTTWYWQSSTTGTSTANSGSTFNATASGTYYLRAYNSAGGGCWSTATAGVSVTLNSVPAATSVSGGGTVCGTSTTLTASGGSGGTIYFQGTTSGGTSTATPGASQLVSANGTYYFRSRSAAGCWGPEGSVSVTFSTPPAADAGPAMAITCTDRYTLSGSTLGAGQTGLWTGSAVTGGGSVSFDDAASPTAEATFTAPGLYQLTWTVSAGGCTPSADQIIVGSLKDGDPGYWTGLAATVGGNGEDWNDCRNWADGVVPTSGTVILTDVRPAYLGGTAVTALPQNIPAVTLNTLVMDNPQAGGAALANGAQVTLTGTLKLARGWIVTPTNAWIYVDNGAVAAITDAGNAAVAYSNTAYVRGTLRRRITGADAYAFPVGDAQSRFVNYVQNSVPAGGSYTEVRFNAGVIPAGLGAFLPYEDHNASFADVMSDGSWEVLSNQVSTDYSLEAFPGAANLNFCGGAPCMAYTLAKKSGGTWSNGSSSPALFQGATPTTFKGLSAQNSVRRNGYTTFSEIVIVGSPALPMPIEQLQLNGDWQGAVPLLTWVSVQEQATETCVLERSANGRDFTEIHRMAAQGYHPDAYRYRAEDHAPLSEAYYRVYIQDLSGARHYSNTVLLVRGQEPEAYTLRAYPNPASNTLAVTLPAHVSRVTLYNTLGQAVHDKVTQGETHSVLDIQHLAGGAYTLVVQDGTQRHTLRVIKQ